MSLPSLVFASLLHLQAQASTVCVGFSILLVVGLVAAEEVELRRDRRTLG